MGPTPKSICPPPRRLGDITILILAEDMDMDEEVNSKYTNSSESHKAELNKVNTGNWNCMFNV